jgi:hypothetical protein
MRLSLSLAGQPANKGIARRRPLSLRKLQETLPTPAHHTAAAANLKAAAATPFSNSALVTDATPAVPLKVDGSSAAAAARRQLLQEHECDDGEFWIQCNSEPLCWGIGRGAPSTGETWQPELFCYNRKQRVTFMLCYTQSTMVKVS